MRFTLYAAILALAGAAHICQAASVNLDLLLSTGDFAKCTYSRYPNSYEHGDLPTPDLTVADGWCARGADTLTPANYVFRMVTANETNYQYMALKGVTSGSVSLTLEPNIPPIEASIPQTGDTVTFEIDKFRTADCGSGAFVQGGFQTIVTIGIWGITSKQVVLSSADTKVSLTAQVPANVDDGQGVHPYINLWTGGNLGSHQPGVYISGAHLYVRRKGSQDYETENIPVVINRSIRTHRVDWSYYKTSTRSVAALSDDLRLGPGSYPFLSRLRKLNPSIRIYLYEGGMTAVDTTVNARWALCPFTLSEVVAAHPEWLYPSSPGASTYWHYKEFPDRYPIHVALKDYQDQWSDRAISYAQKLGVDGVWIDDTTALTMEHYGIVRQPFEVQQFLHAVIPKLRTAGLSIVLNLTENNLDGTLSWNGDPTLAYLDPSWVPNDQFRASQGYTANTPNNTPDVYFQELSFIQNIHGYHSTYWLRCINDAGVIAKWNQSLPAAQRRRMHYYVNQRDEPSHPAFGPDGWVMFSLASYLLCQNDYTSLAINLLGQEEKLATDYSITQQLGNPDGANQPYNGDTYCRYRRYKATADGAAGGVVVVNANTELAKTYVLDFNAVDESGNDMASGTKILLKPNTGRILIRKLDKVNVNLVVPSGQVIPGQKLDIVVEYTNPSSSAIADVTLRVQVPAQMTYVAGSAEASSGVYDPVLRTIVWHLTRVAGKQAGSRKFQAVVE